MSAQIKRVFSGIQPSGIPHLGNYFGAISQWIQIANERKIRLNKEELVDCDTPVFSIVDVHAYSAPNIILGEQLYENTLSTLASLLSLGLHPDKCILFRQSDILEHNYLDNVLDNFVTPQRLSHMTQFKDKSKSASLTTNGLLNYPVLQAADILVYRSHLVPVGHDQLQHIELTRDIATKFNSFVKSDLFPLPVAILSHLSHANRIKSLRNPEKKMSKSDSSKKSFIRVIDEPEEIVEKCKKAITDTDSAVYYDAENRPGVSNLMRIYHLATGDSLEKITDQFRGRETAKFKLKLADVLIDKFAHARKEYKHLIADRKSLENILKMGANKARPLAEETIIKVKHFLGSLRS